MLRLFVKSSPPEFASFFRGDFQSLVRKFLASDEFSNVQGELLSLVVSDGFERVLNMDQTQEQLAAVLKKISHFVLGAQGRLIKSTHLVTTTDCLFLNKVVDHSANPLSFIVKLEPDRLAHSAVFLTPMVVGVSPPFLKKLIVTHAPSLVELLSKDAPPSYATTLEQNEEWLSAMVDTADEEMVNAAFNNPMKVLVQGVV
nr:hypothetical protein [Tanacetum cinerariifolium]